MIARTCGSTLHRANVGRFSREASSAPVTPPPTQPLLRNPLGARAPSPPSPRTTLLRGASASELLRRSFCVGASASELLRRSFCVGASASELLRRSFCVGASASELLRWSFCGGLLRETSPWNFPVGTSARSFSAELFRGASRRDFSVELRHETSPCGRLVEGGAMSASLLNRSEATPALPCPALPCPASHCCLRRCAAHVSRRPRRVRRLPSLEKRPRERAGASRPSLESEGGPVAGHLLPNRGAGACDVCLL